MPKKQTPKAKPASAPVTRKAWFSPQNHLELISAAEKLPQAKGKAGRRRFRLLTCACCRRIWHLFQDPAQRKLIELAEEVADERSTMKDLAASYKKMRSNKAMRKGLGGLIGEAPRGAAEPNAARGARRALGEVEFVLAISAVGEDASDKKLESQIKIEERKDCDILRDIFGDPFRPISFDPRWRTSTVVDLARTIYEGFPRQAGGYVELAILADALMDVGCDDEQIIAHCRGPGPHVRGCWVVDLLLGKA